MNRAGPSPAAGTRGFTLVETMLAVAIFTIAVLVLAECVNNCLRAERFLREDEVARRILENRMAEIEAGAVETTKETTEDLKGDLPGLKLKQSRSPVKWKNEKKEEIAGLFEVALVLTWGGGTQDEQRKLNFYVFPRPR